ncbi:hypothetical protein [Moorena producens]|nr:hypothetical protein [Moorena producens]
MATLREQPSNLGLWPRFANNLQTFKASNLQTLAFGHASRTTFKPSTCNL